jgi:hypothetical protein
MPLNWKAIYPKMLPLAEAEIARRLRLAEQASAVAEELAHAQLTQVGAESLPQSMSNERQMALTWLGTTLRAWEAVLECYPENSREYQAGRQRRQQLQQSLLALLRQAG